jgi:uncharacterized protein YraI
MKYSKTLGALALALAVLPATSFAEMGYVAKAVNLRAGPATEYPIVAMLQAGVAISVEGCLSDYRWCDVVAGPSRGWIYAANIVYPYQGQNVPVLTYGALIGLGIVAFSVGDYWDHHYRASPWYPQRQRWIDRPGFRPGDHRPPAGPGFRPGDHRPPVGPGFRPGDHRPPAGPAVRPGNQRPPQGPAVRPGNQRSPQGQGRVEGPYHQPGDINAR